MLSRAVSLKQHSQTSKQPTNLLAAEMPAAAVAEPFNEYNDATVTTVVSEQPQEIPADIE